MAYTGLFYSFCFCSNCIVFTRWDGAHLHRHHCKEGKMEEGRIQVCKPAYNVLFIHQTFLMKLVWFHYDQNQPPKFGLILRGGSLSQSMSELWDMFAPPLPAVLARASAAAFTITGNHRRHYYDGGKCALIVGGNFGCNHAATGINLLSILPSSSVTLPTPPPKKRLKVAHADTHRPNTLSNIL